MSVCGPGPSDETFVSLKAKGKEGVDIALVMHANQLLSGCRWPWLLDEPLNGLDAAACATVERIIAEHGERGGITVIASHQAIAAPRLQRRELAGWIPVQDEA